MADSVVKLRVDSQEYDAKIRRAADGLRAFGENCQKAGESVAKADKDTLEYVRAIGQMETVSKTVRGKIGEMTTAFTELSVQYKNLTDEEKKSQFGVALSQSLDQLRTRIGESKAQLQEVSTELGNTSSKGNETGGIMQQLAGKFTLTLDAVKLFNIGVKAVGVALDVAKDAFFASEATVDEWGRTMDANRSLYEGFLYAINNGDISGFLSNINQIISAARAAYDELDRLGTMRTIQAPQISAQQAENDRLRLMIQTGRWISAPGKDSLGMKDGQILTAPQIKALERMLNNGMQNIVSLTKNEVQQTGKTINAFYTRQSKELGMSEAEFRKGTSSMAEFDKRIEGYQRYEAFEKAHTKQVKEESPYLGGGYRLKNVRDNAVNPYAEYRRWGTFRVDGDRYHELVQLIQQRDQQTSSMYNMQGQAYRTMNRAEGVTLRGIMGGGGGGGGGRSGGGGGGRGGGGGTHQETPEEKAAKLVAAALGNYENAVSTATLRFEMGMDNSEEQQKKLLAAQERLTMAYADAYNITQDENYKTKFGEEAGRYNQMEDVVKGKRDLFNTATADLAGMSVNPMEGILKGLLGEDMETYAKRKGINLDTDKDKPGKKEDKTLVAISNTIDGFSGGLSQITGGLEQLGIDVPNGIERMITTMQAISTILTGINTVVMTIAALSVIPFARGGIAHAASGLLVGHHYSGDMVPALLNDGELILNRSQQGNVASQLRNNGLADLQLEAILDGEDIRMAIRTGDRRRGRGEYAYSKTR